MADIKNQATTFDWTSKIILIVEDDICNACYVKEILDKTNVECKIAPNARMALKYFYSSAKIDLVLMDIQLPDINGIELTKKMKAINPEVPIIAQTAFASEYDKAKCLEAGCDNYITKPIEKQAMMELIDSYLNEIIIN